MRLTELAALSERLASTAKRGDKVRWIAALLAAPDPERALAALYLSGAVRQARLGVGYAQVRALGELPEGEPGALTLSDVDRALEAVAGIEGRGSARARATALGSLFGAVGACERTFLSRLMLGELRQGALESVVLDGLAKAAELPAPLVRRAQMLCADLVQVAERAFAEGEAGLAAIGIQLFRPVQPMLAEPAEDVPEALARLGTAALEVKLDGARVQVHRRGDEVRVYTRALNEVTASVPELVAEVKSFREQELVLDGEVIALGPSGRPLPFQDTMRRFGQRLNVETLRAELPLTSFFFDCLYAGGVSLLDAPTSTRIEALEGAVPARARVTRIVTASVAEAQAFFDTCIAEGHEGVMAKALDTPYAAGSRGAAWLKLKRTHSLDLVVLAAEWGSGRRKGLLSNLHLGARDPDTGGFVMLGKTFKGLTDATLRFQTDALLARETHRDAYTVYVRPELVVEIELNDVQTSPHYPAGMALRFARVKAYRPDKSADAADSLEAVRALHRLSRGED
jgi:DNA ligase 1